jgi:hypothetical protein
MNAYSIITPLSTLRAVRGCYASIDSFQSNTKCLWHLVSHIAYHCGLKTLFFVSNNRFLLMTLLSFCNRSSTELPGYIRDRCELSRGNKFGTPGRIPTCAKLRFDRRQTIVVVLTPFECKNATRLQYFPLLRTHISYIHHSRYKWKSPLLTKLELIFLRLTIPYSFFLREASLLRKPLVSDSSPWRVDLLRLK